ncbi:MAG: hypothetical protein QOD77_2074 [Thermoplasmata archaeon]|jgi:hypothetical protein|nr:hypothetical protein [Thermoplasmata archaeon]
MRVLALATALLLLAGCGHRGPSRPDDWQDGVALTAIAGTKTHAADETFELKPVAAAPPPRSCTAYEDGAHEAGDTCQVVDGGDAWTLQAAWDGKWQTLPEVEAHPERRTVVAFDQAGAVVAHWDGVTRDPGGAFATE